MAATNCFSRIVEAVHNSTVAVALVSGRSRKDFTVCAMILCVFFVFMPRAFDFLSALTNAVKWVNVVVIIVVAV